MYNSLTRSTVSNLCTSQEICHASTINCCVMHVIYLIWLQQLFFFSSTEVSTLTWTTVIRCWRHVTSIALHPSSCLYKCLLPHPSLTMFPCPTFTHSYSMTRWEWWSLNLINPCSCWPSVGVGLPSRVSRCCLRSLDTLTGTGRLTLKSFLCYMWPTH